MVDVNWFEVSNVYKPTKMTGGVLLPGNFWRFGQTNLRICGSHMVTRERMFEDRVYPPDSKLIIVNWNK